MRLTLPPVASVSRTVYGVVLNHVGSRQAMGDALSQPPYQAPPKAPILYVKPPNTWADDGTCVQLPDDANTVEVGATLALLIGAPAARLSESQALACVAGGQLAIDLSLPHSSYYRPAIREKCFDGACVLGATQTPCPTLDSLTVRTLINGEQVDAWGLDELIRGPARLLSEITAFMTLNPGDRLLLGVKWQAPQARRGDAIQVLAQGLPSVHCIIGDHA